MRPRSSMMIMASGTVSRIDRNRASAASRASAIADCFGCGGLVRFGRCLDAVEDPRHFAVVGKDRHVDRRQRHPLGRRRTAGRNERLACMRCGRRDRRTLSSEETRAFESHPLHKGLADRPTDDRLARYVERPEIRIGAGDDVQIGRYDEFGVRRRRYQVGGLAGEAAALLRSGPSSCCVPAGR